MLLLLPFFGGNAARFPAQKNLHVPYIVASPSFLDICFMESQVMPVYIPMTTGSGEQSEMVSRRVLRFAGRSTGGGDFGEQLAHFDTSFVGTIPKYSCVELFASILLTPPKPHPHFFPGSSSIGLLDTHSVPLDLSRNYFQHDWEEHERWYVAQPPRRQLLFVAGLRRGSCFFVPPFPLPLSLLPSRPHSSPLLCLSSLPFPRLIFSLPNLLYVQFPSPPLLNNARLSRPLPPNLFPLLPPPLPRTSLPSSVLSSLPPSSSSSLSSLNSPTPLLLLLLHPPPPFLSPLWSP